MIGVVGQGRFVRGAYINGLEYDMDVRSILVHAAVAAFMLLLFASLSSRSWIRYVGPVTQEVVGSFVISLMMSTLVLSKTDRLTMLLGHPLRPCACTPFGPVADYYSDSADLLTIIACAAVTHFVMPIRWFIMLPVCLTGLLTYAAIVFVIGSHESPGNAANNLFLLAGFMVVTVMGKRVAEIGERRMFTAMAVEKSLRFSAEFQLSQTQERQLQELPLDRRSNTETGSEPTTTHSGGVFDGDHGSDGCDDMTAQLTKISTLGDAEHWRIGEEEVEFGENDVLGVGSFGLVERAVFCGMVVAVKRPRERLDGTSLHNLPEFCNELRVLRHLRHPSIVSIHGAIVEPQRHRISLVLEYVEGRTLEEFMESLDACARGDNLALLPRYQAMLGVCRALMYMHSRRPRIVHGDLKSNNVLLEQSGSGLSPKLLDFGLSRVLTRGTRPLGGTLRWMAPEVYMGRGPVKRSADVYSFGRLVAFVATAIKPLADMSKPQIQKALKDGQLPMPFWPEGCLFAPSCAPLVSACLASPAESRPSIDGVCEALLGLPPELGLASEQGRFLKELQLLARRLGGRRRREGAAAAAAAQRPPEVSGEAAGAGWEERSQEQPTVRRRLASLPEREEIEAPALEGAAECWRTRPDLPRTSEQAIQRSLLAAMARWNLELPERPCCELHAALRAARAVVANLLASGRGRCVHFPPPGDACPRCGILGVEEVDGRCALCGEALAEERASRARL